MKSIKTQLDNNIYAISETRMKKVVTDYVFAHVDYGIYRKPTSAWSSRIDIAQAMYERMKQYESV